MNGCSADYTDVDIVPLSRSAFIPVFEMAGDPGEGMLELQRIVQGLGIQQPLILIAGYDHDLFAVPIYDGPLAIDLLIIKWRFVFQYLSSI